MSRCEPIIEIVLTHLETRQTKLLQVILVGHPDLNKILEHADSRQIARRVTARHQLRPFCLAETRAYIQHRLTVGGCQKLLFTRLAMGQVHRRSGGIPRKINAICDRALLDAHRMGKTQVNRATALHAARKVLTPTYPTSRLGTPSGDKTPGVNFRQVGASQA